MAGSEAGADSLANWSNNEDWEGLIDRVDAAMAESGLSCDFPLIHRFTPGLYIREIFIPRGARLTSLVHRFEHPYVISMGQCSVHTQGIPGFQVIQAPHTGITTQGLRRLIYAHSDTVWLSFHANPPEGMRDPEELESWICEVPKSPLLPNGIPKKIQTNFIGYDTAKAVTG